MKKKRLNGCLLGLDRAKDSGMGKTSAQDGVPEIMDTARNTSMGGYGTVKQKKHVDTSGQIQASVGTSLVLKCVLRPMVRKLPATRTPIQELRCEGVCAG